MKNIIVILLIVFFMVMVDELFRRLSVPITAMDFILFPSSIVLILYGVYSVTHKKKLENSADTGLLFWPKVGYAAFAIFLAILGVGLAALGCSNPLELFSGVKGATHGYTLVALGILIFIYSVYGIYWVILRKIHQD